MSIARCITVGHSRVKTKQAKKRRRNKIIIVIALALVTVVGCAGAYWHFRIGNYEGVLGGKISFPEANAAHEQQILDVRDAFSKDIINIVLFGFDRNLARDEVYATYRADTIMLASINLKDGTAAVVSIPRDTLVPIYKRGGGRDKINSAYYYGWRYGGGKTDEEKYEKGMLYQVETVSMALKGVPIHYYVSVDMESVKSIVDAIGGVEYDVPKNIYSKSGRLLLEKGKKVLNGAQLLIFVRDRQYSMGDIKRVENQQDIMMELFKQLKSTGNLLRIPKIYAAVADNVKTNLTMEQIMSLAHYGMNTLDTANISKHVMPTSFAWGRLSESWTKSYSYLIINQKGRAQLLYDIWGLEVKPDPTDVIFPPLPGEEPSDESDEGIPPEVEDPEDPEEPEEPEDPEDPEEPEDPEDPEDPDPSDQT